jgi:hypothetical protein
MRVLSYRSRSVFFASAVSSAVLFSVYFLHTSASWTNEPITRARDAQEHLRRSVYSALGGSGGRVAILDSHSYHDEVHSSFLWTLSQFADLDTIIYRPPWRFGMDEAIQHFFAEPLKDPNTFIADLNADSTIKTIVLTTCDLEYAQEWIPQLEVAWTQRSTNNKFSLVCVRHWTGASIAKDYAFFAERDAVVMLGLGDHVKSALEYSVTQAIKDIERFPGNEQRIAGLQRMPIRTYIPIFSPQFDALEEDRNSSSYRAEVLTSAIIQSTHWDEKHRAMQSTMDMLTVALDGRSTTHTS